MINLINVDKFIRSNDLIGPVTSPQYFTGQSYNYHPQGLMSEDIFGIEGSIDRKKAMSWIDLNCEIIHPVLYDVLSKRILMKKINKLLSGEVDFVLDENGELKEDPNGDINGYIGLLKNIDKLRFDSGEGGTNREKLVNMLYNNIKNKLFFVSKLLVVSPDFRPIMVFEEADKKPSIDEMNDIYRRIIVLSNQLKGVSGALYNILSFKMQGLLRDLYEYVKVKVSKKSGMVRNLMLGKRVDFSARTVIIPNPELKLGEVGVPFRIVCSIFEPHLTFGMVNSPLAGELPNEFHEAVKDFLGKELDPELLV